LVRHRAGKTPTRLGPSGTIHAEKNKQRCKARYTVRHCFSCFFVRLD
jgi:hypothetical protein